MSLPRKIVASAVLLSLVAVSCGFRSASDQQAPKVLRFGVLPDQSTRELHDRYDPLIEYLSQQTGIPCELVVPDSYAQLRELFSQGEVDIAHFGGLTFLQASLSDGAAPLVMRDIDLRFTSYFVARADTPIESVEDAKGRPFAFGSELSTSGHLMPRHFLATLNINPESYFFEVIYSGNHSATVLAVRDGTADIGAANAAIVDQLIARGAIDRGDIRIVWETPPYADYVWAAQTDLSEQLRFEIRDAFLALSTADPAEARVLDELDAEYFIPASTTEFANLQRAAEALGLLTETP